jgi:hypothetical protein
VDENNVFYGCWLRLRLIQRGESAGEYYTSGKQIFSDFHSALSPDLTLNYLVDYAFSMLSNTFTALSAALRALAGFVPVVTRPAVIE